MISHSPSILTFFFLSLMTAMQPLWSSLVHLGRSLRGICVDWAAWDIVSFFAVDLEAESLVYLAVDWAPSNLTG